MIAAELRVRTGTSAHPRGSLAWFLVMAGALHAAIVLVAPVSHAPSPPPAAEIAVEMASLPPDPAPAHAETPPAPEPAPSPDDIPPPLAAELPEQALAASDPLRPPAEQAPAPQPDPDPAVAEVASSEAAPQTPAKPTATPTPPRPQAAARPPRHAAVHTGSRTTMQTPAEFASAVPPPAAAAASPPSDPAAQAARAAAEASFEARLLAAVRAEAKQDYPASARLMGLTGQAVVAFEYCDGAVRVAGLVSSSGSSLLDDAALSAVQHASYPPPPAPLAGRRLARQVHVKFELESG